ncbi:MAG: DUF4136 domain-containing protein [Flavobacteriaceae bacterium]|nr:DUF4136 domain-containing protein [Flavobacteriaceae bacterium]
MKKIVLLIAFATILTSCNSIRVSSDYNEEINFTEFKTYAFSKSGIDKVEINDIDKKRILRAIDVELYNKGYRKSSIEPDFLINFFTKTNKKIDYYPSNNYYGYAVPYGGMGHYASSWYLNSFSYNEGVLFIDIIERNKNELVWQGIGKGYIYNDKPDNKNEKIKAMVNKILLQFPPE